jgi:predicted AlkP superfamily pyrophosphatase or phosphodiesterase/Flp pilus assembly protein TadD
MRTRRVRPAVLGVLLLLAPAACGGAGPGGRVLVLGIDGADPDTLDLLMSEGKLPNFARIRQGGAYGRLESRLPLLSPVVWTTIATGKTPDQHRIGHFVAVNPVTGEQLPVTSQMRKAQALWNVASDAGRKVAVVGWWATWPAERVNGAVVSDHLCYHFLFDDAFAQRAPAAAPEVPGGTGNTYPPGLEAEIAPLVRRPFDVGWEEAARFVDVPAEEFSRPFSFEDPLGHFRWALAAADTHVGVGLRLWEEDRPDLLMVYVEGVDSASHLFGHLFRARGLAGELSEQQRRYGRAVEAMYLHADAILGRAIEALDRRTTLVVLSDHGFRLGELPDDPSRTRDMRRVSERYHTLEGILYLYGAGVKSRTRIEDASILDVAPTILALLDLPAAVDMPGKVLAAALRGVTPPERVATYETGAAAGTDAASGSRADPEILEKLRSLGYLEAASPSGDRNLAAVLFSEGRYAEAAAAYEALVARDPNDGALRASLAGALGALGRYDDALREIDAAVRLQPLNPEAHHNRAVIHERRGDVAAAVADYEAALRYAPDYEPARRALRRLRGTDRPFQPRTPEEAEAFSLAERASLAARRGDYEEAGRLLDQAERTAPRLALVHQYRSNVAYLKGDRAAAAAALRRGLEIEPDNALFRENLKRLEAERARP